MVRNKEYTINKQINILGGMIIRDNQFPDGN